MDLGFSEVIEFLSNKIFNEAGLVAVLLFWGNMYQAWDKKSYRAENTTLHEKILTLAIEQTKTNAESNNVLDKMSEMLTAIHSNDKVGCKFQQKE